MNYYYQIVFCCDDISFLRENDLKYTVIILQVRQKIVQYNKYSSGLNGAVDRRIFQLLSSGRQYYKHKVEDP